MVHILADVVVNQFGNYLCQKLIEVSSDTDLSKIVDYLLPHCVAISSNIHGTRVIQTLVEVLASRHQKFHNELTKLITELNINIVELSTHTHGNHVIQAFLTAFRASEMPSDKDISGSESTYQYTQYIFDACISNCTLIGRQKHGCCVM